MRGREMTFDHSQRHKPSGWQIPADASDAIETAIVRDVCDFGAATKGEAEIEHLANIAFIGIEVLPAHVRNSPSQLVAQRDLLGEQRFHWFA